MNWPHEWTLDGSRRAREGVRPATRRPERSLPWPGGAAAGRGTAQEEGAGRVVLVPTASRWRCLQTLDWKVAFPESPPPGVGVLRPRHRVLAGTE